MSCSIWIVATSITRNIHLSSQSITLHANSRIAVESEKKSRAFVSLPYLWSDGMLNYMDCFGSVVHVVIGYIHQRCAIRVFQAP